MNKTYPEYIDLSLFNFPSHIDPNTLLNLEIGIPIELEPGLRVIRETLNGRIDCIRFHYVDIRLTINHNPYGPSVLLEDGSVCYCNSGKIHRLDGHAFIYIKYNGTRIKMFYVNDISYPSELEYWIAVEKYKEEHSNE